MATENDNASFPLTPPTTPRPHFINHSGLSAPVRAQLIHSISIAPGEFTSLSSPSRGVNSAADVPPLLAHPLAARSRGSSGHEPLSKRFSLRHELALAVNADIFGRRGSGSSAATAGTEEEREGAEDGETAARRLRASLLVKVAVP